MKAFCASAAAALVALAVPADATSDKHIRFMSDVDQTWPTQRQ